MIKNDYSEVEHIIREAFAGVTLGKGVGLWWGQVLDDYKMPASIADYRANHEQSEERLYWSRIPVSDLNYCNSSLSFFDAEGMRFHLPAFLIAELHGEYGMGNLVWTLDYTGSDYSTKQFSMLNTQQRMAIRAFLLFVEKDIYDGGTHWSEFDLPYVEKALAIYCIEELCNGGGGQ